MKFTKAIAAVLFVAVTTTSAMAAGGYATWITKMKAIARQVQKISTMA